VAEEPTGVGSQAGDDPAEGVPSPEGMTPTEGVPAGPGMAPAEQGVQPAAPMAPREVPEGYVSQADMDALRSEMDRRNWAAEQQRQQAQQDAQRWRHQAETKDMSDEEKWKYLYDRSQEQIEAQGREFQQFQSLLQAQQYIAEKAGIDPGKLNPWAGVYGMMEQAFEAQKGAKPPARSPSQPVVQPITPAKAPSPPTSTAPKSSFEEWASGSTFAERQKKVPKGKSFEEWMEELGEE